MSEREREYNKETNNHLDEINAKNVISSYQTVHLKMHKNNKQKSTTTTSAIVILFYAQNS